MKVKEIMESNPRKVVTVYPETIVKNAMARLIENGISSLPVVQPSGELVGIITDKDIFKAAFEQPESFFDARVSELMTQDLIVGVEDDEIDYIAGVMTQNRIRHVPIVEKRKLVGLISVGDVVKSHLSSVEIENRYLRQFINDSYPA